MEFNLQGVLVYFPCKKYEVLTNSQVTLLMFNFDASSYKWI